MSLALRSRRERRRFAIEALKAREEAVRRGAIAVLEREWPGNHEAEQALLEVVRTDSHSRVRQAALAALGRAWSGNAEILAAIAGRIGEDIPYTYADWLVSYLLTYWRGSAGAVPLLSLLAQSNDCGTMKMPQPWRLRPVLSVEILGCASWHNSATARADSRGPKRYGAGLGHGGTGSTRAW